MTVAERTKSLAAEDPTIAVSQDPCIYLCGPITGTTESEFASWRGRAANLLGKKYTVLNPPTQSVVRARLADSPGASSTDEMVEHGSSILARDRANVIKADLILVNFVGAREKSIGSIGEIFWADAYRKPVVIAREATGNPHDHLMINEIAMEVVSSLEEAVNRIKSYFETS